MLRWKRHTRTPHKILSLTLLVTLFAGLLLAQIRHVAVTRAVDHEACRPDGLYRTPGVDVPYCQIYDTSGREVMPTSRRIIGYFTSWRHGKDGQPTYLASDIPWAKLTHINYAFAHVGSDWRVSIGAEGAATNAATGMTWPGLPGAEMDPALPYRGHFNLLTKYKRLYPQVKTLVSIGGWAETGGYIDDSGARVANGGFYAMTIQPDGQTVNTAAITTFADSVVAFLRRYGFDGADIDYEYATSMPDAGNPLDQPVADPRRAALMRGYGVLMKTLREKLDAASAQDGKYYQLTVAAPASAFMLRGMESYQVTPYLDFLNLMSYDLHGAWNEFVGPNAALYDDGRDAELAHWSVYGTPEYMNIGYLNTDWGYHYFRGAMQAGRINIGVPYYTRGWKQVTGGTNGLWGKAVGSSCPPGLATCGAGATGIDNIWRDIDANGAEMANGYGPMWHAKNLERGQAGSYLAAHGLDPVNNPDHRLTGSYTRFYDATLVAPWLWNAQKQVFLSTEDEQSIAVKADYVINTGLGGVMFWELAGDYDWHPSRNDGAGEYYMGDTLTSLFYDRFRAATPYGATRANRAMPSDIIDVKLELTGFKEGMANYPINPNLQVTNNSAVTLPGGTVFEFDYGTGTPGNARDQSGVGLSLVQSDHSGSNIGGLKGDFHRARFTLPTWQTLAPGASTLVSFVYYLPLANPSNVTVTFGGRSYKLAAEYPRGSLVVPPVTTTPTRTNTGTTATRTTTASVTRTTTASTTATRTNTITTATATATQPIGGNCTTGTQIQAETYDRALSSGVAEMGGGDGTSDLGAIDAGDWAAYPNVTLPASGCIEYRVASPGGGGTIEARIGSATGTLVSAACAIPATAGWASYTTRSCPLAAPASTHTLYLKFGGTSGSFQLNWLKVLGGGTQPPTNTPTSSATRTNTVSTSTATSTNTSVTATATNTTCACPPSNLLLNGGFENDGNADGKADSWTAHANVARSSAARRSGTYALRHQSTTNNAYIISQVVSGITAGGSYSFGGYTSIPATSDAFTYRIELVWRNSSNATLGTTAVKAYTAATSGWNLASGTYTAPAGATNVVVRMNVSSLNATIYSDDFSLTRSTTVTATSTATAITPTNTSVTPTNTVVTPSSTRTNTPITPTSGPDTGLKAQYKAGNTAASTNQIAPHFNVVNGGTTSVALAELKLRYYYSKEGTAGEQFNCDWATLGCGNVTGSFAAGYLEVGFLAGAGSLAPGAQSGDLQTRFNKSDWTSYDQANDYSFDPAMTAYADHAKVTLHHNGALVWGTPPGGNPITNTPTATGVTSTPTRTVVTATPTRTGTVVTPTRTSTIVTPTQGPPPAGGRKMIGYFQQWGIYSAQPFLPKDIDAAKLNVINYAFGNVSTDNKCYIETRAGWGDGWADFQRAYTAAESVDGVADTWDQRLKGNFNQMKKLKAKYPGLKVVISLGGWTWSGRFSDAALPQNREAFVTSCIDLYIRGNLPVLPDDPSAGGPGTALGVFDGIDVDWEYPAVEAFQGDPQRGIPPNTVRPEDTQNFTALLQEFRRQLDLVGAEHGKYYTLTIAAPAGPTKYNKIEVAKITPYLDWINLMTYDFHGNWDALTGHLAPMYPQTNDPTTNEEIKNDFNTNSAVQAYLRMGVPAHKLIMGVPFYGRGVNGVQPGPRGDGLYQPHTGAAHGTWDNVAYGDSGLFDASDVKQRFEPVSRVFWDTEAQVPYLLSPQGVWITYENTRSIGIKADYIKAHNLGGGMIWELGGDRDRALITTLYNGTR